MRKVPTTHLNLSNQTQYRLNEINATSRAISIVSFESIIRAPEKNKKLIKKT